MELEVKPLPAPSQRSWTIGDVLKWSTQHLKEKGSPSARLDAEIIVAAAIGCKRIELYTGYDKPLSESERAVCRESIRRRTAGEPVAYIVGHRYFWNYEFKVDQRVLIPRSETEMIVDYVTTDLGRQNMEQPRILDVGTGSGCIAITVAKEFKNAAVEAWDISADAIALARENAGLLGVENLVFKQVDALQESAWTDSLAKFDYILSNPPYVDAADQTLLAPAVKKYEPHLALFADHNGLLFYSVFAGLAGQLLNENGKLIVELGIGQKAAIERIFLDRGWPHLVFQNDLAGIPRVLIATKSKGS